MEITTDAILRGPIWTETIDKLVGSVFETYWDLYALSISIGMMYDTQINSKDMDMPDYEAEPKSVPRTVLGKSQNKALLEFMLQSALVSTKHLELDEDARLELAFSDSKKLDFNAINFLTGFSNFGITKIHEAVKDTDDVETLEVLMTLLNSTYESGINLLENNEEIVEDE